MKFLAMSTPNRFLLFAIVLLSIMKISQASAAANLAEMSSDDDSNDLQEERRAYDLKQLRHFLLTSNDEQRAAKREKQDFLKRQLVNKSFSRNF